MGRTGLLIALAIAAVVGLVFALRPTFDLDISRPFFDPATGLWSVVGVWWMKWRDGASWLIGLVAAPAFVAVVLKLVRPRRPMLIPGRAALLMIVTLALGPGLLTNVILKDGWGRPRPIDVTEFGGSDAFVPWWDPRGPCPKNCSFVAGEPSGAFWTLAPAALVPPAWRVLATGAALVFGAAVGLMRIAGGGHFFSDVVFSGVFTFLVIWLAYAIIYRWRPTRIADETVERILAGVTLPARHAAAWIAARVRGGAPRGKNEGR
jgi:membrane-associated PAP2 superfamily phosphatase